MSGKNKSDNNNRDNLQDIKCHNCNDLREKGGGEICRLSVNTMEEKSLTEETVCSSAANEQASRLLAMLASSRQSARRWQKDSSGNGLKCLIVWLAEGQIRLEMVREQNIRVRG